MDEEVHGFVPDSLPPLTEWEHTHTAFVPNGSDPSAHEASFAQHKHRHHKKPDIAERGVDGEIYGFVKEYTNPENEMVHSENPMSYNGGNAHVTADAFA
jgi:hypothetical protein